MKESEPLTKTQSPLSGYNSNSKVMWDVVNELTFHKQQQSRKVRNSLESWPSQLRFTNLELESVYHEKWLTLKHGTRISYRIYRDGLESIHISGLSVVANKLGIVISIYTVFLMTYFCKRVSGPV